MTEKAKRIIKEIFDVYKNNPDQLPYNIWPRMSDKKKKSKDKEYAAICHYIAGMTDRFALAEVERIT